MQNRLDDRRIVVTGAGSGIGAGTALRLLEEGAQVVGVDLDEAGLAKTVAEAELQGISKKLITAVTDISSEDDVASLFDTVDSDMNGLDAVVNAAGILIPAHTHEMSLDLWNKVIGVNLTGTFLMCRAAIPRLLVSPRDGVIVNFSSTSATFAHPYMAAYAASKGAIASFTHTIALEYTKQRLRAVSVCPGGIASKITTESILTLPSDADSTLFAKLTSPFGGGSFGEPRDVAGVIAMLISDDGKFITGTEIRIDGGAHM
ncbi:MAG: SDR family NAD(P)-dependent oxidoreductase [Rhodococcus sp. (in: high G+C Gram-positive bacteria)]